MTDTVNAATDTIHDADHDATAPPAGLELVITRVLDAPRALVYRAFTDPDHIARWIGPKGFTATRTEGSVTPGGAWRSCVRSDSGDTEYWSSGVYREVVELERLVYTFAWEEPVGTPGRETLITVTLADQDGKTMMTFRQSPFESVEDRDGHVEGWSQAFDDLAAHLAA